jgi:hypothetical protein
MTKSGNETRLEKVNVLMEATELRLKEEEGDLFKKAKKVLSDDDEFETLIFLRKKKCPGLGGDCLPPRGVENSNENGSMSTLSNQSLCEELPERLLNVLLRQLSKDAKEKGETKG